MKILALGHVVLKVRNLERSVAFYRDVLNMRESGRHGGVMVFFSFGCNHHDLALLEIGTLAAEAPPEAVGLYHVAFKVGNHLDDLRAVKAHLEWHGVPLLGMSDHAVSQSLYLHDPDGIEIELYVDAGADSWGERPMDRATVKPLRL